MNAALWRWWGPLVLYMALIFFVSSRARPASLDRTPDVLLHAGAYFVMGLLAIRALARGLRRPAGVATVAAGIAIAVAYGASDELHQSFVPERVGSWLDFVYDAIGAVLAGVTLFAFWHYLEVARERHQ